MKRSLFDPKLADRIENGDVLLWFARLMVRGHKEQVSRILSAQADGDLEKAAAELDLAIVFCRTAAETIRRVTARLRAEGPHKTNFGS